MKHRAEKTERVLIHIGPYAIHGLEYGLAYHLCFQIDHPAVNVDSIPVPVFGDPFKDQMKLDGRG